MVKDMEEQMLEAAKRRAEEKAQEKKKEAEEAAAVSTACNTSRDEDMAPTELELPELSELERRMLGQQEILTHTWPVVGQTV